MVMISPQITTTNPAPAESRTSRIGTTWPEGAPRKLGSVEKRVLRLRHADRQVAVARRLQVAELVADRLVGDDVGGAVDLGGDRAASCPRAASRRGRGAEAAAVRGRLRLLRERRPPCGPAPRCPPSPWPSAGRRWPRRRTRRAQTSRSARARPRCRAMKWLIATTAGTPNLRTFSMCRPRLARPFVERLEVLLAELVLGHAAMHLEGAHRGDDHRRGRLEARPCGT